MPPAIQSPQPGTFTLQVNTQAVVLDVVVTDAQGKPVTNLPRDAFQIFEDKAPQTIRSFEAPEARHDAGPEALATPVTSTRQLDRAAPMAPVLILVLDEINTSFEDANFARYSLKKYLNTMGGTLPEPVMLIAVDMDHFTMLHDYTTSSQEILLTVEHHVSIYPFRQKTGGWQTEQFNRSVASVLEIAQATAGHPGHKGLIWVGRGFPAFDPANLSPAMDEALDRTLQTCTNALRDARIVMYTLDPAGVPSAAPTQDPNGFQENDPFSGQVDFNALARATGGEAFYGRNDVDKLISISARDTASFYTLSYDPERPAADTKTFHNIRVVMRDPNLHAATREGYYNRPPASPVSLNAASKLPDPLVYDLTLAAQTTLVYDAVPLTVTRAAPEADEFTLTLNAATIPWQPGGPNRLVGNIALIVDSFDRKGKQLSQLAEKKVVHTNANPVTGGPVAATIVIPTRIATRSPAARLRFIVRLDNGKLGADNLFLTDEKTLADLHP